MSSVRIETPRLMLRLAEPADVPAIVRYYEGNRDHLGPYEPRRPEHFYTELHWHRQVELNEVDREADRALRLFLFKADDPRRVIGLANFTNFVRGVKQSCTLGYSLDETEQGQGHMREALEAAIPYVFDSLAMHRVEANYMPHNRRSGALLKRLGFVIEGYARDYVQINGVWEDHVLTSLTNLRWGLLVPS